MAKSKPETDLSDLFSAPEGTTPAQATTDSGPGVEAAREPTPAIEKPPQAPKTRKKPRAGAETPAPASGTDKATAQAVIAPASAAGWLDPGTDPDEPAGPERQLVIVGLSQEQYGIDIARIDSIIKMQPITAVPRAPDFVQGITNLRGTVLPVIDLRQRFNLNALDPTPDTRIVVAEIGGNKVGVIVDAVIEVRRIPQAAIEPPSPLLMAREDFGSRTDCITGIAKINDGRLIMLLDLEPIASTGDKGGR